MDETGVTSLSLQIQWAVAPVFLLTGIAGFMAVLSARLSRAVDRARMMERRLREVGAEEVRSVLQVETDVSWRRVRLINWSLRLLVGAALSVCCVVVALFVGELALRDLSLLVSGLFVIAMVLIITGLLMLLIEVTVSTRQLREGIEDRLAAAGLDGSSQATPDEEL